MAKPFDYYAGYPGQQATPKWVGIVLGSVFGGLLLVAVGLGVHLLLPARAAQASVAPPAASVAPQALAAETVTDDLVAAEDDAPAPAHKALRSHGPARLKNAGRSAGVAKSSPRYKKAQTFAKSVSRKDKKARDELDKMLGL